MVKEERQEKSRKREEMGKIRIKKKERLTAHLVREKKVFVNLTSLQSMAVPLAATTHPILADLYHL